MVRFAGFIVVAHAAMLAGLLGVFTNRLWAAQIVSVTLGLAMISIGNLLPRTRPNLAIGIRTARTLWERPGSLWITNAPIGGLHAGGARVHHRAVGDRGPATRRSRNDSRCRPGRDRRRLRADAVLEQRTSRVTQGCER